LLGDTLFVFPDRIILLYVSYEVFARHFQAVFLLTNGLIELERLDFVAGVWPVRNVFQENEELYQFQTFPRQIFS
jgi:TRAP-type mannitol/chloroaromatic compound transport system permease small subunit